MAIVEELTSYIGVIIVVLICIGIFFILLNQFTGGMLIRMLTCSIAFWFPFGPAMGQYCQAIPV